MRLTLEEIVRLAEQRGARDVKRVVAGVSLAIRNGDDPDLTFDSLQRNQPDLFGPRKAKQPTPMKHWVTPKSEPRRNERRWQ
jgi:hypothetical protein